MATQFVVLDKISFPPISIVVLTGSERGETSSGISTGAGCHDVFLVVCDCVVVSAPTNFSIKFNELI